ncbi:uncharacterized protein [Pyrus communis]|uniref:uncharacterized protein n=1 Tax=Pyrus communis TaxID=23211 RepID=UPI0035C0CBFE
MTNLAKLGFIALDITGKNYFTWVLDAKIHLEARNLGDTIKEDTSASSQDRAKAMIFISEQNNEFLMKNHQSWPIGSAPFPEVNDTSLEGNTTSSRGNNYKQGHGHKRGRWNGKGKNHGVQFHNQVPMHNTGSSFKNANRQKGKAHMNTPRNPEEVYHRCGGNGHWAHTCRTPKHLVDLYQASFKEKAIKTNFLDKAQPMEIPDLVSNLLGQLNTTHLDVSDFITERGNEVYGSD